MAIKHQMKLNLRIIMSHINFSYADKMINAEDYILKCFEHCNIIGFGEGAHGLEDSHRFLQKMIENKKIQEIIDVIIVEFANIDYQSSLDKYIYGEEIDIHELRNTWRESTQSPGQLGEISAYFELLQKYVM